MNNRVAKTKTLKRTESEVGATNSAVSVSEKKKEISDTQIVTDRKTKEEKKEKKECSLFLQYQSSEFNMEELKEKVFKKCETEMMDCKDLRIYVKPEDGKAYYVCAGGSSSVDL